jgi:hypothetical protein
MANSRLCSIEDCGKLHFAKTFCSRHYRRFHNHGDPLLTKIRADGKIKKFYKDVVLPYEGDECIIWPFSRNENGYGIWKNPKGGTAIVSRSLCEEIHGPPEMETYQAAHSCGNGKQGCVTKRHIFWKTKSENEREKLEHGTHNRGERHGRSKLTEAQVREILSLKDVELKTVTAQRFGVSDANISAIHSGKRWGWLQSSGTS